MCTFPCSKVFFLKGHPKQLLREKMVFLFLKRPSPQDQKACIDRSGAFNYDSKFMGSSSKPLSSLHHLSKEGFFLNHARVLLGSGRTTFDAAKTALLTWKHFSLNWTFVDPNTRIKKGTKFCVCVKEIIPWMTLPLQMAYITENTSSCEDRRLKASFGFGSGTLRGHLLAGEERFSIELDENDRVWYEILSFSKPAHFITFIGYPYVQLRQKYFAHQSMQSVLKYLNAQQSQLKL